MGTLNVRLVSGFPDSVQPGTSPDPTGFYARQYASSGHIGSPMTFRFTFDTPLAYIVSQNETLTNLEQNTFTTSGVGWSVLTSSNVAISNSGPVINIIGTLSVPPYGNFVISSSSQSFDFTITNFPGFPEYGSAISLDVVATQSPSPLAS